MQVTEGADGSVHAAVSHRRFGRIMQDGSVPDCIWRVTRRVPSTAKTTSTESDGQASLYLRPVACAGKCDQPPEREFALRNALAAGGSFNSPFRGRTLRRYLESRRPLTRRP
jgi:hypothetical protein